MANAPKVGRRRPAPPAPTLAVPLDQQAQRSIAPTTGHAEPGKPNPYPRRVTLDLSDDMYSRLRTEAFRSNKRLSELGREALDAYLPDSQASVDL